MENFKKRTISPLHFFFLTIVSIVFIWSAVKPDQWGTWFLEVAPVTLGTIFLVFTYNRFRFTTPVYLLLSLGVIIVLIGGHYTYGKVPLFSKLNDMYHLGRNYYDRFGHFINGFIWALTIREILLRISPLQRGKLLITINAGLVLTVSALYEIAEWLVAMMMGGGAEAFLGLQGDIWDTQWDMFLAFTGGILCLLFFSSIHNKFIHREITERAA